MFSRNRIKSILRIVEFHFFGLFNNSHVLCMRDFKFCFSTSFVHVDRPQNFILRHYKYFPFQNMKGATLTGAMQGCKRAFKVRLYDDNQPLKNGNKSNSRNVVNINYNVRNRIMYTAAFVHLINPYGTVTSCSSHRGQSYLKKMEGSRS